MKKRLTILLLSLLLVSPGFAQSLESAGRLAEQMSQAGELAQNERLRFQVIAYNMEDLDDSGDIDNFLNFFADTRVLFWNRSLSPNLQSTMMNLENQIVALARKKNRQVNLSRIGYAPASRPAATATEADFSRDFVVKALLETEQQANALLAKDNSADLLFLRDNLSRLREDMGDGSVSVSNVRSVMGARVRILAGSSPALSDMEFRRRLDLLGQIFYRKFPPEVMRGQASSVSI